MKDVAIIGSTGSIGKQTLEVVRQSKGNLKVGALAAKSNIDLLCQQIEEFSPELVAVFDKGQCLELQKRCPRVKIRGGMEGLLEAVSLPKVNLVISAIVGSIGLLPTIKALEAGKDVALANKESLVAAGSLVMKLAQEKGAALIPIDSEHSAIFQCLQGAKPKEISKLILTASGGAFRDYSLEQLKTVSAADALKHPVWSMGAKITVDSSTLMNKGLEVIEAYWLFGVSAEQIEVVVHPQSIIHSMVEFIDGSILAQLGVPSMLLPIHYALNYPERKKGIAPKLDFTTLPKLEFRKVDTVRFPALTLAYEALKVGGSLPCYMNGANEVLVQHFLNGKIKWIDIPIVLEKLMEKHAQEVKYSLGIEEILEVDKLAREEAYRYLNPKGDLAPA